MSDLVADMSPDLPPLGDYDSEETLAAYNELVAEGRFGHRREQLLGRDFRHVSEYAVPSVAVNQIELHSENTYSSEFRQ